MNRRIKTLFAAAAVSVFLSGCGMQAMNQLYCMPRRPDSFYSLQNAVDSAMQDMEYCAPLTGANQQAVQTADLDGDGTMEYLLFARGNGEKPLNIFIFRYQDDAYILDQTISFSGSAFEQVDYVQLDNVGGMELIVGCQVSEQLTRSVSVYSYREGKMAQVLGTNYNRILTNDFNGDGIPELLVIRSGALETDNAIAQLYGFAGGEVNKSVEVEMSQPVSHLKRMVAGKLEDGAPAVYVASNVDQFAVVTDVLALQNKKFTNISREDKESQTVRKYSVYADDVDQDGVLEMPCLLHPATLFQEKTLEREWIILWYSMDSYGNKTDKAYSFHNFDRGWSIRLESPVAPETIVTVDRIDQNSVSYQFGTWDSKEHQARVYMTVYELEGPDREEEAAQDNRFVLQRTESVVYAARMETVCAEYGITQDSLIRSFGFLNNEWIMGKA